MTWDLSPTAIHCVAVDPAGQLLACAGGDGTITILDTSSDEIAWVWNKEGKGEETDQRGLEYMPSIVGYMPSIVEKVNQASRP